MSGRHTGVQTRILQLQPNALYVHCRNHVLDVGFGTSGLRICHLCCQRCPVTHKWPCYILQRFCEANRCTWVDYKGYMLFKFRCETTSTESNALDNSCPCSECSHTTLRSHCCCTRPACRRARINWLQSCRLLELESGNHHVELIKVQTLMLFQIV